MYLILGDIIRRCVFRFRREATDRTRRHSDYHERIHASQIGRCEGRTGADESKGAVKKGDDLGGHGVCQKGNKTSE